MTARCPAAPHVAIAGGGFAAVEAMLALRALAGKRVRMTLISASPFLAYRPAATAEAFDQTNPLTYDLRDLTGDLGVAFRLDRLESLASTRRHIRLASFGYLDYDVLVLALGARAVRGIPGALVFRDQRDTQHIRTLARGLLKGELRRVVFAVPSGRSWPLPLYELALGTATQLRKAHNRAGEVVLVSPEATPLEMFGAPASQLVSDEFAELGVLFIGKTESVSVARNGLLTPTSGEPIDADRVVTAPRLRGPRITGVPTDSEGFATTDGFGRVSGLSDVYAAGDMTNFPIKQGGLATQQADVIAQLIATDHGAPVKEIRSRHVLHATLIGGARPIVMRTDLDEFGRPTPPTTQHSDSPTTSRRAPEKVFARYLSPYLQNRRLERHKT